MSKTRSFPRRCLIGLLAGVVCGVLLAACGGSKSTTTASATTSPTATSATTASTSTTPGQGASSSGTSRETAPGVVRASQRGVSASLHATTHHPRTGAAWPISFAVTSGGTAAKAEVAYEYLFGGQVVAHRSHYRFTGTFHDLFRWPASAVGYPLTFRAVIMSGGATLNLDYPVQVVR
jgi:hypothetical protein